MRDCGLVEFISKVGDRLRSQDSKVVFFLGAGASRSSGIPTAGELVARRWIPRARKNAQGNDSRSDDVWAQAYFPGYDPGNPAKFYGRLIDEVFHLAEDRQREIEDIVVKGRPAVGYGLLARLMAHPMYSRSLGTVLTTNFDDMLADALLIHTRKRARVIGHHSLAAFIRNTLSAPQIIKLHGDAQLAPLNTGSEIKVLPDALVEPVKSLLAEAMLVFIGYGGADPSIHKLMEGLTRRPTGGVWWVNPSPPADQGFIDWMGHNECFHVKHLDFDEFMVLLAARFDDINLEMVDHFIDDRRKFEDDYKALFEKVTATSAQDPDADRKMAALTKLTGRTESAWGTSMQAWSLRKTDPEKADKLFVQAAEAAPDDARILGNYALFVDDYLKDFDRAEALYERALTADPEHASTLGNYATFMKTVRKDFARAEALYERALTADPEQANTLGNYANFMKTVRKDFDRAEALYERALTADPENANTLGNYAFFMQTIRQDFDRAEALYERALKADNEHANTLGNYALFMKNVRRDFDRAETLYERALTADPDDANTLGNYAVFMQTIRQDFDRAEALYERALTADPDNANNLGNYAFLVQTIRKDFDRAEALYERALTADPEHANSLGNFGGFLLAHGQKDRGFVILDNARRILASSPVKPLLLEIEFYHYVHGPTEERDVRLRAVRVLIDDGVRSPNFDLSDHVALARQERHPEADLIAVLAGVIADQRPAEDLDGFSAWDASRCEAV